MYFCMSSGRRKVRKHALVESNWQSKLFSRASLATSVYSTNRDTCIDKSVLINVDALSSHHRRYDEPNASVRCSETNRCLMKRYTYHDMRLYTNTMEQKLASVAVASRDIDGFTAIHTRIMLLYYTAHQL